MLYSFNNYKNLKNLNNTEYFFDEKYFEKEIERIDEGLLGSIFKGIKNLYKRVKGGDEIKKLKKDFYKNIESDLIELEEIQKNIDKEELQKKEKEESQEKSKEKESDSSNKNLEDKYKKVNIKKLNLENISLEKLKEIGKAKRQIVDNKIKKFENELEEIKEKYNTTKIKYLTKSELLNIKIFVDEKFIEYYKSIGNDDKAKELKKNKKQYEKDKKSTGQQIKKEMNKEKGPQKGDLYVYYSSKDDSKNFILITDVKKRDKEGKAVEGEVDAITIGDPSKFLNNISNKGKEIKNKDNISFKKKKTKSIIKNIKKSIQNKDNIFHPTHDQLLHKFKEESIPEDVKDYINQNYKSENK